MCKKDGFFNVLMICMIVWSFTLLIGMTIIMFKDILFNVGWWLGYGRWNIRPIIRGEWIENV